MFKITVDPGSEFALNIIEQAVQIVERGVSQAAEIYGKRIIGNWRRISDSSAVPNGPTSTERWRQTKERHGLHTEDLQRLGRSDSRSYYQNLYFRPLASGLGWFVGVLDTTPAYNIKFLPNGEFDLETASYSLSDVAEGLEEKYPIWKMLYFENMTFLYNTVLEEIINEFNKLGFTPGRAV